MKKTGKIVVAVGGLCVLVGTAFILAGKLGGANPKMDSHLFVARIMNKIEQWDDLDEIDENDYDDHEEHREQEHTNLEDFAIEEIEISVGARNVLIKSGDVDEISYEGVLEKDKIYKKGNKFYFVDRSEKSMKKSYSQKTVITLPNKLYKKVEIETGAGKAELNNIMTKELSIEVGAGSVESSGLVAEKEAEIIVGAGEFFGDHLELYHADIECGIGKIEINGNIYGKSDLECGMGDMTLNLEGKRENYHIEAEGGMSDIRINGKKSTSFLGGEYSDSYDGKEGKFSLECGMGKLEINFKK